MSFSFLIICQHLAYLLGRTSKRDCGIFLGDLLCALCIRASFHKQDNAERGFLESFWMLTGNLSCGSEILIIRDNARILSGGRLRK